MKKYTSYLLFLAFFFSCSTDERDDPAPPVVGPPEEEVEIIEPVGTEQYLNTDSDYIFDQQTLHTFELNVPAHLLNKINNDPAAEQYVEGSLTFEGETISPVGVRYKGSVGAFVACLSGDDWSNPSGSKICTKLSMKVKINWEGREEKFYGLKKLQFHSMNLDDSQMRERLGYWLFREMGVPAPRSVHARLIINGQYNGIYALTEQIDGRFARYNFEDGTGNLYKEIWPLHMNGQPFSEQTYISHLKTNEDENPTAEIIRTFATEVRDAGQSELQNVIAKWMDVDEILSYAVVDRTIRHDDGPFHWYCGGGECSSHNFYWYEEPTANTLHLIPWDLDNAFENIISNQNPVTPIADDWGETSNNCQPFNYGAFNMSQLSAACDKLTAGWASFEEEYAALLTQFKEGPLSQEQVDMNLDKWKEQIRSATLEAHQLHDDAISIGQWEGALNQLKSQCNHARNN
ncbi:MAG: CotH kinase family protein [Bacteroidota bacterium]